MTSDHRPPILGGMTTEEFARKYWQQQPLFIKNAFSIDTPFTNADILELSTRYDVEARLVEGNFKDQNWQLSHGPFTQEKIKTLPKKDWSLLIQGAEEWSATCQDLFKEVSFLPQWFLDDIMVSLSPRGGGVGPHIDSYGVFLVQLLGSRVWQIGHPGQKHGDYDQNFPLKILKTFTFVEEWICEPGDVLYLPPHIAHNGTTISDYAQTYSIGILPPRKKDLFLAWCMDFADRIDCDSRLTPDITGFLSQDSKVENAISDLTIRELEDLLKFPSPSHNELKTWLQAYFNVDSPETDDG